MTWTDWKMQNSKVQNEQTVGILFVSSNPDCWSREQYLTEEKVQKPGFDSWALYETKDWWSAIAEK